MLFTELCLYLLCSLLFKNLPCYPEKILFLLFWLPYLIPFFPHPFATWYVSYRRYHMTWSVICKTFSDPILIPSLFLHFAITCNVYVTCKFMFMQMLMYPHPTLALQLNIWNTMCFCQSFSVWMKLVLQYLFSRRHTCTEFPEWSSGTVKIKFLQSWSLKNISVHI